MYIYSSEQTAAHVCAVNIQLLCTYMYVGLLGNPIGLFSIRRPDASLELIQCNTVFGAKYPRQKFMQYNVREDNSISTNDNSSALGKLFEESLVKLRLHQVYTRT